MRVLRANKDSVMAMLEAFVHDPLISWRLLAPPRVSPTATAFKPTAAVNKVHTHTQHCLSQLQFCTISIQFALKTDGAFYGAQSNFDRKAHVLACVVVSYTQQYWLQ
jgi:phosphatidylinositol kinase/protein kinase (PI-3  family)